MVSLGSSQLFKHVVNGTTRLSSLLSSSPSSPSSSPSRSKPCHRLRCRPSSSSLLSSPFQSRQVVILAVIRCHRRHHCSCRRHHHRGPHRLSPFSPNQLNMSARNTAGPRLTSSGSEPSSLLLLMVAYRSCRPPTAGSPTEHAANGWSPTDCAANSWSPTASVPF